MVFVFLLIGIAAGLVASTVSLLMDLSFGWAFLAYIVAGDIAIVLAGIVIILRRPSTFRATFTDRQYSSSSMLGPAE